MKISTLIGIISSRSWEISPPLISGTLNEFLWFTCINKKFHNFTNLLHLHLLYFSHSRGRSKGEVSRLVIKMNVCNHLGISFFGKEVFFRNEMCEARRWTKQVNDKVQSGTSTEFCLSLPLFGIRTKRDVISPGRPPTPVEYVTEAHLLALIINSFRP